ASGGDGVDAELRPLVLGVARLAGEQAEHDVSGRARPRATGRGRGRARAIGGAHLLRRTLGRGGGAGRRRGRRRWGAGRGGGGGGVGVGGAHAPGWAPEGRPCCWASRAIDARVAAPSRADG